MATQQQILQLRIAIGEMENKEPWTDEVLGELVDASGSVRKAAHGVWMSKATSVAHLVDISEGGSSRKMGDIYDRYVAIAGSFEDEEGSGTDGYYRPRTRPAERA